MNTKSLENISHIYFIGVGGIGMSALARWFVASGRNVAGYDKTETPLTKILQSEGINIHYSDEVAAISPDYLNPETTLIIFTPAVPKSHKELNYFRENGFNIQKRAEVLGLISRDFFTVGIAGTHGKTSTTSIVAHLLKEANLNCTAFLGGITKNYNSNLVLNKTGNGEEIVVIESDEFDRSFLTLNPNLVIITTVEADHLDIYGSEENLKKSFNDFIGKVPSEGKIFIHEAINQAELSNLESRKVATYGIDKGEFKAQNIRIGEAKFTFDIEYKNNENISETISDLALSMPGFHNVSNTTAAVAIALELGISKEKIQKAVATYKGVKRRFEFVVRNEKHIYIDDYAHHPTEIEAFIKSVKALYPQKKLTVIFQPHLFTRTRDFAEGFAKSLSLADCVILLNIYPARELPIEGINSQMLLDKITIENKFLVHDDELLETIRQQNPELLATVGAGNIDKQIAPLKEMLQ